MNDVESKAKKLFEDTQAVIDSMNRRTNRIILQLSLAIVGTLVLIGVMSWGVLFGWG